MIQAMTKYSFLIYHKDYENFLNSLREMGIAHIIENNTDVTDEIREQFQKINQLNLAVRYLERRDIEKDSDELATDYENGEELFDEIRSCQTKSEQFKQKKATLEKQINELSPWGDFSTETIEKLKNKIIGVRLFICQNRKFEKEWEADNNLFIINQKSGYTYFVVLELNDEEANINAEEVSIPVKSLSQLENELKIVDDEILKIDDRLDNIAKYGLPALENYKKQLIDNIEYDKAVHHTINELENNLKIVEAWCPAEKSNDLDEFLNKSEVYYLKSEPKPEDKVPVLLKNKKFNKDFEVIGEMYSLPKYGEMDLTPFFAPFYALFFGFCLGDIGYGILMAMVAIIYKPKAPKELKPVMNLVTYLGTATILFGMVSGTFFGINLYEANLPIYSSLQEYFEANNTDVNSFLFYLSLMIGGVQIIFGLIIKAVNETIQFGWKLAVGTMGWILLLVGMIAIYLLGEYTDISGNIISNSQNVVLIISGSMILLFNNLKRKIYINLGIGLWNTYNMITGILGDLLSYIRLFALGISSAILGYVFNSLAISMSGDIPVLSIIIMVLILVVGHAINIFMSGLGAFVHPMRLTFVEFYKNAGFTGGGKKYHPFKKMTKY